jgi:hypothetical protein
MDFTKFLPEELALHVFAKLTPRDLLIVASVSKEVESIIGNSKSSGSGLPMMNPYGTT